MKIKIKIKGLFIIYFACFSFNSCFLKKKDSWSAQISGQVKDYYTNKKISNVNLIIEKYKLSFAISPLAKIVDTITTDVDGNYHYSFNNVPFEECSGENYQISVLQSEKYAPSSEVISIEKDKSIIHDFKIKPFKRLKIILTDTSHNSYDRLNIGISLGSTNDITNNFFTQDEVVYDFLQNKSILFNCIPESNNSLSLFFYRNNQLAKYNMLEKYCSNSDTSEYEIKY